MSQLTIDKILGSSSRSSSNFVVRGNLVGYIASGGVVVCQVNRSTGQVQSQRFYCANSKSTGTVASNSANDYLKLAGVGTETAKKTDEFGFSVGGEPEVVSREGSAGSLSDLTSTPSSATDSPSAGVGRTRRLDDSLSTKLSSRLRAINSIEISPDRRLLAVGEVGYQPRILIYSLASDATTRPVVIIQEHQFGINSLCFSPDSTKLCSLGLMNDGFLNIWKIKLEGSAKTFTFWGSNKCSSVVNKVLWHESWILTLGLRHIKVWKIVDDGAGSGNTIIKGRNVLLRNFLNSSFIDAAFYNFHKAYVLTDQGELAALSLNDEPMQVAKVGEVPSSVNRILIDTDGDELVTGGTSFSTIPLKTLVPITTETEIKPTPSSPTKIVHRTGLLAMEFLGSSKMVYLTDDEEIRLRDRSGGASSLLVEPLLKNLVGIKKCSNESLVLWSKSGWVKSYNGTIEHLHHCLLPGTELIENALHAVEVNSANELITGDKFGKMTVYRKSSDGVIQGFVSHQVIRAHESSINDVCCFEHNDGQYIASGSRDRTVQIFVKKNDNYELHQTLAIHKGNIHNVVFNQGRLFVSSSDRTVSVHQFEGDVVVQEKLMALKNSPTCMKVVGEVLIVSTSDKTLQVYSIGETVSLVRTLKLMVGTQDSIQVESFTLMKDVLVVTSTDKSIRCYSYPDCRLLCSGWGHSESVIGLEVTGDDRIVSASADGCLFEWTISDVPSADSSFESSPMRASPSNKVLRKVLPPPGTPSASSTPKRKVISPTSRLTNSPTRLASPVRSPSSKVSSSPSPPRSQVLRTRVNSASVSSHEIDDIVNRMIRFKVANHTPENLSRLKNEVDRFSRMLSSHLNLPDEEPKLQKLIESCSDRIVESVLEKINGFNLENKENE